MTTILIADDDPNIRRLVRVILTDAGFDVVEAENGEEALAILDHEAPRVMLLDLNMPVMDGRELFHRLQDLGIRPRTIIISAGPSERTRLELGAEDSLQKPFGPEDLIDKVCALSEAA